MLLPDNIHPENSIYYNGALVLEVLHEKKESDLIDLYEQVKQLRRMTFPVFLLCLDWLYLVNIAEVKNGRVQLCS